MRCVTKLLLIFVVVVLFSSCDGAKKKKKSSKGMILRQKETNAIEFIRITVMRLVYGIATRIGLEEQISEALNGAFVPPGVDDYDYGGGGGFGILGGGDDYDY